MTSRHGAERTGSITTADNRLRPALRSLSREQAPAGTEPDDPLVELARLVSRRPFADVPAQTPPPPPASPPPATSDLSADLEAELLSTLEASLAEALAAEADAFDPPAPEPDPIPQPRDSAPRYAALHLGSAMEDRIAARPLRQPANTDAPPPELPQVEPDADPFANMALRRPARTSGPAYNPNALGPDQPQLRAQPAPPAPSPAPTPTPAPPPAPARARQHAPSDPFEVVARHELDEGGARHVHLDFHLDVPVFEPPPHEAHAEIPAAAQVEEPAPQALFEHRPPYVAPAIHDVAHVVPDEDEYDPPTPRDLSEANLRRAGVRPRRRRGSAFGTFVVGIILIGGAAAVFFLRGEGTAGGADEEPILIVADNAPLRVIAPEPVAAPVPGDEVFDRVNPGEARTTETLLAPVEPAVNLAPPPAPTDGITQFIQPPGAGATNTAGTTPEPRVVRTVTVRPDGTIVENGTIPPTGTTPTTNAAQPITPPPANGAANPPDILGATPQPTATAPTPAQNPAPAAPAPAPAPAAQPAATAAVNLAVPTVGTPIAPGFYVQVASQGNEAAAQATITDLRARAPSLLGNKPVVIQRALIPQRGTFYRVQFGPAASEAEAQALCRSLQAVAIECIVAQN